MSLFFELSEEVADALAQKKPLLALESTLITHGFSYPDNVEIALRAEAIAREHQVTPATIAIINGKIKCGLSTNEIEELANKKEAIKASRRDLAYAIAEKRNAGTTVAATLYCANQLGIKVFATGGIGGVHRGEDWDISADLIELARTPLAVVCAGAKSILDLPKTLEFLETLSIPIIGYKTKQLPSFYSATSKHALPFSVDTISALVNIIRTHWQMQESSGILITNPIPRDDEIAAEIIEPIIEAALMNAVKKNIKGKNITPFLLNEVATATQQKSSTANKKLIENNVSLGAKLAHAIAS
jgi:pseudouridine-5'-phosphate glycosidase